MAFCCQCYWWWILKRKCLILRKNSVIWKELAIWLSHFEDWQHSLTDRRHTVTALAAHHNVIWLSVVSNNGTDSHFCWICTVTPTIIVLPWVNAFTKWRETEVSDTFEFRISFRMIYNNNRFKKHYANLLRKCVFYVLKKK